MVRPAKKKQKLDEITSSRLGRGLSLINLSLGITAKYAARKVGGLFEDEETRRRRNHDAVREQFTSLAEGLGRLKGSMMKAGQLLAVLGDHFLPGDISQILRTLHNQSEPLSWPPIEKVLRQQLGDEILQHLDVDPTAYRAASLGQVHRARHRKDQRELVVKVQYPCVDAAIDSDLASLKTMLSVASLIPSGPHFDGIFAEVRAMLHAETDYRREAEAMINFREMLAGDPRYVVPEVIPEYSTRRILTTTFEPGCDLDGPEVARLSQGRRTVVAAGFLDLMYREIFSWRLVQTDPHFGNYALRVGVREGEPDRLVLYDFGAMRRFSKVFMTSYRGLVLSAIRDDHAGVVTAGRDLGFIRDDDSPECLRVFADLCIATVEPFSEKYQSEDVSGRKISPDAYRWGESNLLERLAQQTKDAAIYFRLRPPPRETVFLHRKLLGSVTLLNKLHARFGPRKLVLKYLLP